jgi:transcription initiation factor TFIID subunit 2
MSFAGMTIFDARLLHPSIVIDQLPETRKIMAHALAHQFFGKYISPENDRDFWITTGLAGYIFGQWLKRTLGENEYRYWLRKQMTKLTDFEFGVGPVCLSPKKMKKGNINQNTSWGGENDNRYFSIRYIQSQSHDYHKMLKRKSILVMRIFEDRITTGLLNQAVNKLLVLAERICKDSLTNLVTPGFSPEEVKSPTAIQNNYYRGSHVDQTLTISTAQFLKACKNVCHRELQDIVDQWVYRGGIVDFKVKFKFDKNRNTLDISVEQTQKSDHGGGVQNYRGNMAFLVQELDGSFPHTVSIKPPNEKLKIFETKDSLGCHSRSRAKKAKKNPVDE